VIEVEVDNSLNIEAISGEKEIIENDLRNTCSSDMGLKPASNCGQYYECVNGVQITRNCPPGTVFLLEKQNCGWATTGRTECMGQEAVAPEEPTTAAPRPPATQSPPTPVTSAPRPPPVTQKPVFPPSVSKQCTDEFMPQPGNDMKVICYFTNWAIYR
jgi:Chitin binding Peritrophin-A domain